MSEHVSTTAVVAPAVVTPTAVAAPRRRGRFLTRRRVTTGLAVLTGAAVSYFGLNFLFNPAAPDGFGIDPWPTGNGTGYFAVKGVRDLAVAATVFLLLARGQRRTLGWVVLIDALMPLGDAFAVLTHGGSLTTALSVHVSAASVVLLTAFLLLTEGSSDATDGPRTA
ncbi:DUF4267 domain-containing protein [Streptomyces sp. VRA16 Mangrove soil]|uniref:DUF4267 domain-containing protein n=1 Tax=Streptomyces sp. VRA16 Mangrove soil TaxID=2817434 RepID=UPI001A9FD9C4|nr:DUF4267 domain-containing protein [Streptomyces sp. VRA16 Mangrove soil]MBO1333709.1 DUF4267 domain-containing protein [Streptomyces sp. VRA16 Mangrove soil]